MRRMCREGPFRSDVGGSLADGHVTVFRIPKVGRERRYGDDCVTQAADVTAVVKGHVIIAVLQHPIQVQRDRFVGGSDRPQQEKVFDLLEHLFAFRKNVRREIVAISDCDG